MRKQTLRKPIGSSIRTTLGVLVDAEEALARMARLQLPLKVGYHVSKLAKLVRVETAHFQEKRTDLIKQLGDRREPTKAEASLGQTEIYQVKRENNAEFKKKMDELAAIEVEIAWRPLRLNDLGDVCLAPADIILLDVLAFYEDLPADAPKA